MEKDFRKTKQYLDAVGVGCQLNGVTYKDIILELEELKLLANTNYYKIKKVFIQRRDKYNPSTFIGKGKINDLVNYCNINHIKIIIFNDEISPTQIKNIQKIVGEKIRVVDRTGVIIDIFSNHARTKEAKVQVEIAKLEYLLPRLTRLWTHLERQMGGRGTRGGPGETQIEVDRRLINNQISSLKEKLKTIAKQRKVQSKNRFNAYKISLCGYTNAGKSTLMKKLTKSNVYIKDELFATLDSTSRKMFLNNKDEVILSDTVGFINKLPHNLVASFRSTLSVIKESNLILKVFDATSKNLVMHNQVIDETLEALEVKNIDTIIIFNKIDLIKDEEKYLFLKNLFNDAIFISADKELKLNDLLAKIEQKIEKYYCKEWIFIPYESTKIMNLVYKNLEVLEQINTDSGIKIKVKGNLDQISQLKSKISY
ncbi:MAG: GTPase HflX [Candidatus Marinimicrobia bacterium]|nr:GTPase HflX [Candidatus Neomarinimicrobiota bacterium]